MGPDGGDRELPRDLSQQASLLQLFGSLQHHCGVWCLPEAIAAAQQWPERLLQAEDPLPVSAFDVVNAGVRAARSEASLLPALRAAAEEGAGAATAESPRPEGGRVPVAGAWRAGDALPAQSAAAQRYEALAVTVFGPASLETAAAHCLVAETALGEGRAEEACHAADSAIEVLSHNRAAGPGAKTAVWLLRGRAMEAFGRRITASSSYRAVRNACPFVPMTRPLTPRDLIRRQALAAAETWLTSLDGTAGLSLGGTQGDGPLGLQANGAGPCVIRHGRGCAALTLTPFPWQDNPPRARRHGGATPS